MQFFLEFSCPSRVWTEFGSKIFFLSFSAYLIPFWLKLMPELGFLICWIFCYSLRNFLPRVKYERNLGLKFFSLFLGLTHPNLVKNNVGKGFFSFLNFFAIFFGIFFLRPSMKEFGTKIFFSPFRPISSPLGYKYCGKEVI